MSSISSQSECTAEPEIQKMLKLIQNDALKIKKELFAINAIVKHDGPLSLAIKNSIDALLNTAAKKGIDVEDLKNAELNISATDSSFLNHMTSMDVTQRIEQLLKELQRPALLFHLRQQLQQLVQNRS